MVFEDEVVEDVVFLREVEDFDIDFVEEKKIKKKERLDLL